MFEVARGRANVDIDEDTVRSEISELYLSASAKLRRYVRKLGASWDETEDIVAQTFEIMLTQSFAGKGPDSNAEGYLFTVAKRQLYKLWQTRVPSLSTERDEVDLPIPFSDQTSKLLERTLVGSAFSGLTSLDQTLVWRLLIQDESAQLVADDLGLTATNVRTRFHRAKQTFREKYLEAYARVPKDTECQNVAGILGKHVLGTSSALQERKLQQHLAGCNRCNRVLAEVRDEASSIRRIPISIWGPVGLGGLLAAGAVTRTPSALALAARAAAGVAGVALLVAGLTTVYAVVPTTTDASAGSRQAAAIEPTSGPVATGSPLEFTTPQAESPGGSSRSGLIEVTPASTHLTTPAPGHTESWSMTASNITSTAVLPIHLEVLGYQNAESAETMMMTIRTGGETVFVDVDAADVIGHSVLVAELGPGESIIVDGGMSRAQTDVDPSLTATVDFRFSTETDLPEFGTDGSAGAPGHSGDGLAGTGTTIAGIVMAAAGLVLIGIRCRRSVERDDAGLS